MPSFTLPTILESASRSFVSLSVGANVDISRDALNDIKAQLPLTDNAYHASVREPVKLGTQSAELSTLIGVHDFEPDTLDDTSGLKPGRRYLHYALDLRATSRPRTTSQGDWDTAVAAMKPITAPHAADVGLRLTLAPSAVLAIKLPISIGSVETPGFSEIRGVRLSQLDPEDPSSELYSVILDRIRRKVAMSVHTVVEVSFGGTILETVYRRAISIAELAAWEEVPSNVAGT